MKTSQIFQTAGLVAIITMFIGASVLYFSFIQQMISFIVGSQISNLRQ